MKGSVAMEGAARWEEALLWKEVLQDGRRHCKRD